MRRIGFRSTWSRAVGDRVLTCTGVAALVLPIFLAACGDDEADTSSSAFCESVTEIDAEIQAAEDRDGAASGLADQADRLASLEPPDEIADEWQVFVQGISDAAHEQAEGEESDGEGSNGQGDGPGGSVESAREDAEQAEELQIASRIVTAYLEDNCGLQSAEE